MDDDDASPMSPTEIASTLLSSQDAPGSKFDIRRVQTGLRRERYRVMAEKQHTRWRAAERLQGLLRGGQVRWHLDLIAVTVVDSIAGGVHISKVPVGQDGLGLAPYFERELSENALEATAGDSLSPTTMARITQAYEVEVAFTLAGTRIRQAKCRGWVESSDTLNPAPG